MTFHDVRLPEDVEVGARGGPTFHTTVVAMSSGTEQRNIDWSRSRMQYDISYGISKLVDLIAVRDFFYGRRAMGYGFRFKDWADYEIELGQIGVGDGAQTAFQIVKVYELGGPLPFSRKITRPVANTVKVYKDGVLQTLTMHYTLNASTGMVTFLVAPTGGVVIRVTCEFDVPARFDTDQFPITIEAFEAGSVASLNVLEIRE